MASSVALVYNTKSLLKSGLANIGAEAIASLIDTNAVYLSLSQSNFMSLRRSELIGLTICTKSGTKRWTKLILPMKEWVAFFEVGGGKFWIVVTLAGSILMPSSDTMCPNNFPSIVPKMDLVGFSEIPY